MSQENPHDLELNDLEDLKDKTFILFDKKKPIEAIELFNKILKISPKDLDAHFYLGIIYTDLNEHNKALRIDPDNKRVLNNLGNIYKDKEQFEKANEYYNKVLKTDPE
ncbi:MAG: tetratricopeptide repeat protein [Candidatus Lokiarchaeota archaeon]|nr:tetratricopeptide repeat protein [Candidatus Lokiarchaeota archaeon]